MVNQKVVATEKGIRTQIRRNLLKEYLPSTKSSIDFIKHILDEAYCSDLNYDVSDLEPAVREFAEHSTHQKDYCLKLVDEMHFSSDGLSAVDEERARNAKIILDKAAQERKIKDSIKRCLNSMNHPGRKDEIENIRDILEQAYRSGEPYDVSDMFQAVLEFASGSENFADYCTKVVAGMKFKSEEKPPPEPENNIKSDILIFFDVEVFPNLFIICYKEQGPDKQVIKMINPKPEDVAELTRYKLIGFNCRQYDNHILYGRILGYSNEELYAQSRSIIDREKGNENRGMIGNAYNLSYTDIYDFSSEKKSLKKFEIELGIHHQELGLPWDQPVPEELWSKVADYCVNDVLATEAVWNARQADFTARQIQVELVKALHGITSVSVNDTTNSLSEKIIFGSERNTQTQFNYRDLSKPVSWTEYAEYRKKFGEDYIFHIFDDKGLPTYEVYDGEGCVALPDGYSILPFFPGYKYEFGKSTYLGEEIGEGGRVFSRPGIYDDVWDGDIASQHPHSVIAEVLFGPKFTRIFRDLVQARVAIKHKDFEKAGSLLNGVLKPWLTEEQAGGLAQALKIIINSIYGETAASFMNRFRDPRNVDNIVAKRGALFMTLLKSEVEKRGAVVCHIKTDSIKIPNATDDIREFVIKFGREYGYEFETEADFDKFCLVNDAVYVAKYKKPLKDKKTGNDIWWTATGTQFQIPYVFKTLFSGEELTFSDFCETKSVSKGAIVIDMNENLPQLTSDESKELSALLDIQRDLDMDLNDVFKEGWDKVEHDLLRKVKNPVAKVAYDRREKTLKRYGLTIEEAKDKISQLQKKETESHNYIFVGRVGQFTPIMDGGGGGVLYRNDNDKYYAVAGTKGFRWLESEVVRSLDKQDKIDRRYYDQLAEEAVRTIDKVGEACGWGGYSKLVGKTDCMVEAPDPDWPPGAPEY